MGLKQFTIVSKSSDTSYAGTALFNSTRIKNNGRTVNTNNTWFEYAKDSNSSVFDKYEIDEAIATFDDIYTDSTGAFKLMAVHDDVNDSASDTTSKVIDLDDIVYGIALPSNTNKSLLWIQSGSKVEKILVNLKLATIEDWAQTGTSTSTTSA